MGSSELAQNRVGWKDLIAKGIISIITILEAMFFQFTKMDRGDSGQVRWILDCFFLVYLIERTLLKPVS